MRAYAAVLTVIMLGTAIAVLAVLGWPQDLLAVAWFLGALFFWRCVPRSHDGDGTQV